MTSTRRTSPNLGRLNGLPGRLVFAFVLVLLATAALSTQPLAQAGRDLPWKD